MYENKTNINWYPGHMAKTRRLIKENINEEYAPKYSSTNLSKAYRLYSNETYKTGLSESLEEKIYKSKASYR